jgi:hypothetical protein
MYELFIHKIKLKSISLFNVFLLIPLKWNCNFKKIIKNNKKHIYIVPNLFLDFEKILTWNHSNNSHKPIHYSHGIINIIKI